MKQGSAGPDPSTTRQPGLGRSGRATIPATQRLRQEEHSFQASLRSLLRPCPRIETAACVAQS